MMEPSKWLMPSPIRRLEVRWTNLFGQSHGVWTCVYDSPQFYEWLLGHSRRRGFGSATTSLPATGPAVLPVKPGHHLLTFDTTIEDQPYRLDYLLYVPREYSSSSSPLPAILFLHEQDNVGHDQAGLAQVPMSNLNPLITTARPSAALHRHLATMSDQL